MRARSASDRSAGGFLSVGILRSGLRFRDSSNILFWRAFKRIILDTRGLNRGGNGLLATCALFLDRRRAVALLETAHHHGGDKLLLAVIVELDHDALLTTGHDGA